MAHAVKCADFTTGELYFCENIVRVLDVYAQPFHSALRLARIKNETTLIYFKCHSKSWPHMHWVYGFFTEKDGASCVGWALMDVDDVWQVQI